MWDHQSRLERAGGEPGYVLVATAVSLFTLLAAVGLAIDVGRMYVARGEVQNFVDAAALAACLELDGTRSGLDRARELALHAPNFWNFGTSPVTRVTVEFAPSGDGPWEESPAFPDGYRFVRVSATVDVPLSFIRVVVPSVTRPVVARAVAGQILQTSVKQGSCPFSPFAHNMTPPHYGLVPGQLYTLRWSANPRLDRPESLCPGDAGQEVIDLARAGGGSERGYIEETSASAIRKAILYNYQTYDRGIGGTVVMTGGVKQTIRDALRQRVGMDTDPSSASYAEYINKIRLGSPSRGNGARLIVCPINTGYPDFRVVQFGTFFLLPAHQYQQGAQYPFCAEYVGVGYVQGSDTPGAGPPGYYEVKLVQ